MKTKTTQELREIEKPIEKIVREHLDNNNYLEFELYITDVESMRNELVDLFLSLIAKHEAELVESVRTEVIGEDVKANLGNNNKNEIVDLAINGIKADQRAKLTALTEKESKE